MNALAWFHLSPSMQLATVAMPADPGTALDTSMRYVQQMSASDVSIRHEHQT